MRKRFLLVCALWFSLALAGRGLLATTPIPPPDDNPTSNNGALKAQVETGGSYDAHSGNATRSINDLHVPGAPGVYGLDFTRHWNSVRNDRYENSATVTPEQTTDFASPGWSHSWAWSSVYEEDGPEPVRGQNEDDNLYKTSITITFPDGHASKYRIQRWGPRAGYAGDPRLGPPYGPNEINWPAPGQGVHDRLCAMDPNGLDFWLHLADGGSVHFTGGPNSYVATEVFDPHGLKTTLHYNADWQLDRVIQDGGRELSIRWDSYCSSNSGGVNRCWSNKVIGRVEYIASPGSAGAYAVEYHYCWKDHPQNNGSWLTLTSATYLSETDPATGANVKASYTYEDYNPPYGFFFQGPHLTVADDPHYAGPMRFMRYSYQPAGCLPSQRPSQAVEPYLYAHADYFYSSPTAVAAEIGGFDPQSGSPIVVSSFGIGCFDGTRTESNGLGGFRKFFYGRSEIHDWAAGGFQLAKVTDFTTTYPLPANLPFERQNWKDGQPWQVWDGRGIMTQSEHADGSGSPTEVRHVGSDGSFCTYDRVNPGNSEPQDFSRVHNTGHHWLFSKTDERYQPTIYTRDARRRVKRIDYQDGSYETFEYDTTLPNSLNLISRHRLPSGAIVTYDYDGRGRLSREYNSADLAISSLDYTTYSYYGPGNHPEWTDLVWMVQNGQARAAGKTFSTKMEYNGRQQVTKVTYPATDGGADPFVTYEYDANGNCTAITNELGHRSDYTYDNYRRCTSLTEQLGAPGWNATGTVASRRWDWLYDRYIAETGYRGASTHTSNVWRIQVEPAFNPAGERRMTNRIFDLNNRIVTEQTGWIQPPGADNLGAWYPGPDLETHYFTYDENGNKRSSTDPLGRVTNYQYDLRNRLWKTIEPLNRITEMLYDTTGNKTDVIFPDTRSQHWRDYDPFGQAWRFLDERNNTTNLTYCWGPMKKLAQVITHRAKDGGGTEDQRTTFYYDGLGRGTWVIFPDTTSELTTYLFGQVDASKRRNNNTKRIHYDARGREDYETWDANAAPRIDRVWDIANRLTKIWNNWSTIEYTYDKAGEVLTEKNTVIGSGGPAQTNYYRYGNGDVAHIQYPNGTMIRREYTARGQLALVQDSAGQQPVHYFYLADGKVNYQTFANGTTTAYAYDGRGMIKAVHHKRTANGQNLSYRDYWRDNRDRIVAWKKSTDTSLNPMENGRGDRYAYDPEGQLQTASYQAQSPEGVASNPEREDNFAPYDALGNRPGWNLVANRGWMNFARRNNGLNQYLSWENMYPNPPQHWGSAIYYDDNFQNPPSPHPPWVPPGNGNTMADGWIVGAYNALNQPVAMGSSVYWGTSNWVYFGFDPLGRCVKRWISPSSAPTTNPATYFYYDGWSLIQEGAGASAASAQRLYVHGGRVDEIVKSINYGTGQSAFHHYDARGHCTLLTDVSANVLEQYDYDAFGFPYFYDRWGNSLRFYDTASSWRGYSPFGNRFLFTGREWLSDLKLYDYRNRMYQPELGRFLQPDPKEFAAGDYNLYRYCHNDPINKSDPLGLKPGDPFDGPEEAARDAHNFINPTSIKQNAEYGSVIYKVGDNFYASPTFTNGAQTHVTLGTAADKSRIPKEVRSHASRVGDYHSHGDYSKIVINPKDGSSKIERASKSENPESDHPSEGDYNRAGAILKEFPNYRLFLGTPSKELKKYNSKKDTPL